MYQPQIVQRITPRKMILYLRTFPEDVGKQLIQQKRLHKFRTTAELDLHLRSDQQQMGTLQYKKDVLTLDLILLDEKRIESSHRISIQIPFVSGVDWVSRIFIDFGIKSAYMIVNHVVVDTKEGLSKLTRDDFAFSNILFGILESKESRSQHFGKKTTSLPKNYYASDKHSYLYKWIAQVVKTILNQLTIDLSTKTNQEFEEFVQKKQLRKYVYTLLPTILKDPKLGHLLGIEDHGASLDEIILNYLHTHGGELKFMNILEVYVIDPLEYILFTGKKDLEQYIVKIHERNYKKSPNSDPSMDKGDFKNFLITRFTTYYIHFIEDLVDTHQLLRILNAPAMNISQLMKLSVEAIRALSRQSSSSQHQNQSNTSGDNHFVDDDPYFGYYHNIRIPTYYEWVLQSTSNPRLISTKIQKRLENPNTTILRRDYSEKINKFQEEQIHKYASTQGVESQQLVVVLVPMTKGVQKKRVQEDMTTDEETNDVESSDVPLHQYFLNTLQIVSGNDHLTYRLHTKNHPDQMDYYIDIRPFENEMVTKNNHHITTDSIGERRVGNVFYLFVLTAPPSLENKEPGHK